MELTGSDHLPEKQKTPSGIPSGTAKQGTADTVQDAADQRIPQTGNDQLEIIQEFAISLLRQSSLEDLVWDIADNAGKLLGFEDCIVYLREGDELVQASAYGLKNPQDRQILNPIRIPMGSGIVGSVAESQRGEMIPDTRQDPRYIFDEFSGRSEITVPILFEGKTLGVLDSESARKNAFSNFQFDLFQTVANIASPRIASALNEKELKKAKQELMLHKHQLEERVEERTRKITENYNAIRLRDARLQTIQQELIVERDRLQNILESITDGVIATDEYGLIQMISASAERILGTSQNVLGIRINQVLQIAGSDDYLYDEQGKLREVTLKGTIRSLSEKGTQVKCGVRKVNNVADSDLAYVICIQDTTMQAYLESEAEKAQRLDSLGILAGGIAHDFNNQLAAVSGMVSAARLTDGAPQRELLDLAEQACMRSKKLTDQLLTLSKGGLPVIRPCDVVAIVKDAQAVAAVGSSTEFKVLVEDNLPMVEADSGQILQVFENMIINAQQSMESHGQITIIMESEKLDSKPMVKISFRDNGKGIDASVIEKIYDPYFSTREAGHGLGLTTSYAIVQRHKGQIEVESKPGQGATFSIFLPACRQAEEIPPLNSPAAEDQSLRILVLDDDEMVRKSVIHLLGSMGHRASGTREGTETVQRFKSSRVPPEQAYDLAILDLTIVGGQGGLETMQQIKAIDPSFPVVVMSGYFSDPVVSRYEEFGFDGYLQKPFNQQLIRGVIDRALPRKT